jgi:glycosyltransferase involved in cell wall biosynthesis
VVAPAGVDLATFDRPPLSAERRAQLGVPDDYVLFLGTREPRKGLGTLLDAYRRLGADAVPLVVAGGRGWGLQPADADLRVQVLGYVANADVPDLVAGARLLAFPSFYEGFGMPPLEALAAGTAVVASDLPVLREVLGDQATFAPAGDADAWAEALRREWSRSPADDDAARPARRAQAGTFSWARAAAAARSAYDIALERRRG